LRCVEKKLAQWGMLNKMREMRKNENRWERTEMRSRDEKNCLRDETADKRREQLRWTEKKWEIMR
jgi:hypothetical protein